MKAVLAQIADQLDEATSTDAPRQMMRSVARRLRALGDAMEANGDRDLAIALAQQIRGHQYGLRGFGDGSLQRGRDLSSRECQVITAALDAYGVPSPRSQGCTHDRATGDQWNGRCPDCGCSWETVQGDADGVGASDKTPDGEQR